jgi:hypothetical protein
MAGMHETLKQQAAKRPSNSVCGDDVIRITRAVIPFIMNLKHVVCLSLSICIVNLCLATEPASSALSRTQEIPKVEIPMKENFHLFLLAGQSNMAGRGSGFEKSPARRNQKGHGWNA